MWESNLLLVVIVVSALVAAVPLLRHAVALRAVKFVAGMLLLVAGCAAVHVATAADAGDRVEPPLELSTAAAAEKPAAEQPPAETPATETPAAPAAETPVETPPASKPEPAPANSASTELNDVPLVGSTSVIIPPGRPAWVNSQPVTKGEVHTIAVSSGPYSQMSEANRELDKAIEAAANAYIAEQIGSEQAPLLLNITGKSLRDQVVDPKDVYQETIVVSIGPMEQVHALLKFDEKFRSKLKADWENLLMSARLGQIGLGFGGVIGLLATVCGYFRLDNATRGYYTGRLQFLAAAAILTLVACGSMLARMILWM